MPNHAHIFIGMKPDEAVSDLIRDVKPDSANFINNEIKLRGKSGWQEGFGAFSCSQSQIGSVVRNIMNQEKHHRGKTFREEYEAMLKDFKVEYDTRYIFEWIESPTG
jgi:putative transposase